MANRVHSLESLSLKCVPSSLAIVIQAQMLEGSVFPYPITIYLLDAFVSHQQPQQIQTLGAPVGGQDRRIKLA